MKKLAPLLLVLAGCVLAFSGMAFVSYLSAAQEPADAQMSPEAIQEIMVKMMEAAQPGEEHAKLMAMAGEWETKIKMRMNPTGPWENHVGHSKIQKALGGRYIIEKFSADLGMMGQFDGLLILGYNNLTEEFNSVWLDTMSTWPMFAHGGYDDDGNIPMHGLMKDVITPEGRPYRHVTIPVDDDHYITKMYDTIPPQGDVLVMEIEYTRAD